MPRVTLVLINGHAGVGKDTFVTFCKEYAELEGNTKVYNIHRSDYPKIALQTLGWDGEKDEETRALLKHMVDYMELKGLLDEYLQEQIFASTRVNPRTNDIIIFYHVRDPEVMYNLLDEYLENQFARPISVLIQRDLNKNNEPNDWWGDLENADYCMTVKLPNNSFDDMRELAKEFVDFLLNEDWKIQKGEHTWSL